MEQNLPPLPPVIFENGLYYELKARDQMAWVGAMNKIKSAALEILRESK